MNTLSCIQLHRLLLLLIKDLCHELTFKGTKARHTGQKVNYYLSLDRGIFTNRFVLCARNKIYTKKRYSMSSLSLRRTECPLNIVTK